MAGPKTALGDAIGLSINSFESSEMDSKVLIAMTDGNDTGCEFFRAEDRDALQSVYAQLDAMDTRTGLIAYSGSANLVMPVIEDAGTNNQMLESRDHQDDAK